jgi:hypothetical protein
MEPEGSLSCSQEHDTGPNPEPKESSQKMTVFWDVAPCSLVEIERRFRGAYCLLHQAHHPDNGGSKHLLNVGQFPRDYTVQHSRTQSSSHSAVRT